MFAIYCDGIRSQKSSISVGASALILREQITEKLKAAFSL
jgi:hypothetical protein